MADLYDAYRQDVDNICLSIGMDKEHTHTEKYIALTLMASSTLGAAASEWNSIAKERGLGSLSHKDAMDQVMKDLVRTFK